MKCCEIQNAASGKPEIVLLGALKVWFESQHLQVQVQVQVQVHVSLSHQSDYASTFVVVERKFFSFPPEVYICYKEG